MARVLKIVLALIGLGIVFLGVNIGFGGIETLGLQGNEPFINVTNDHMFTIRDSHVRFIGGVWLGVGLVFLAGAFWLDAMRPVLLAAIGMIFLGGLARFSGHNLSALLSADLLPSLLAELVIFPLLALWIMRSRPAAM